MHSLLEWQGRPHPVTYAMRAPRPDFRMGPIVDLKSEKLIGYTVTGLFGRADRTIWVDGARARRSTPSTSGKGSQRASGWAAR